MSSDGSSANSQLNNNQQKVADKFLGNIAVAAGAGTGKTSTLTQRFVNALIGTAETEPMLVSEILAITYTRAAADELLGRVRNELRRQAHGASDKETKTRLLECMRFMDGAWVSTIHGFCARLLRTYAYEVGLDPSFSQLEQEDQSALLSAAIAEVKAKAVNELPLMLELTEDGYVDKLVGVGYESAKLTVAHESLARMYYELGRVIDEKSIWAAITNLIEAPVKHGVSIEDIHIFSPQSDELSDGILTALMSFRLLRLASEVNDCYQRMKRERNVVDFSDLLVFTHKLLHDSKNGVAEVLAKRFKMVMIDEFQDTNRFQLSIFSTISGGKLCTVGDQNQSIYSFQGADVQVIVEETDKRRDAGEDVVSLDVNYRSHPDIISFVNIFFAEIFSGALVRLSAGSEPKKDTFDEHEKRVSLASFSTEKCSLIKPPHLAAQYIAQEFKRLASRGVSYTDMVALVYTRKQGEYLMEAFRRLDIPAEVSGRGGLYTQPAVREALLFLKVVRNPQDDTNFVALCLTEFGRISNQDIADIGQLYGDWDAAEHRSMFGAARLLISQYPKKYQNLAHLINTIVEARRKIEVVGADELIRVAWAQRGMFAYYNQTKSEGKQKWADLRKFREIARSFERTCGTVVDFIEYIDRQIGWEAKVDPGAWPNSEGVVRILTIHESKGQEFPVVAVFVGSRSYRHKSAPPIVRIAPDELSSFSYKTQPVLKNYAANGENPSQGSLSCTTNGAKVVLAVPYDKLNGKQSVHDIVGSAKDWIATQAIDEDKRLLYVACTRAQERLFVVYDGNDVGTRHISKYMQAARDAVVGSSLSPTDTEEFLNAVEVVHNPVSEQCLEVVVASQSDDSLSENNVLTPRKLLMLEPFDEVVTQLPTQAKFLPQASYSHLAELQQCPWAFWWNHVERIGATPTDVHTGLETERKMTASEIGSAIHLLLEQASGDSLDPQSAQRTLDVLKVPQLMREKILARTSLCLQHPIRQRLDNCSRLVKEKQFYIPLGREGFQQVRYVHGYMDVFGIEQDGSALVVDYKVSDTDITFEKYRIQAECYALAALLQGAPKVEVVFVQITEHEVIVHALPEFVYTPKDSVVLEQQLLEQFSRIDAMNSCLAIQNGVRWGNVQAPQYGKDNCQDCVIEDEHKPCLVSDPDPEHCHSYCTVPRAFCWVKQGGTTSKRKSIKSK